MQESQKNNMENLIDPMLTLEEVMENLHIKSKTTVYELMKLDSFPSVKLGKKWLVPVSAYNKWIKNVTNTEIKL